MIKIKSIIKVLLSVLIIFSNFETNLLNLKADSYTGKCGDELTYSYNTETGELLISGTGASYEWSNRENVPWASFREDIKKITVEEGVSYIGEHAFDGCVNVTEISLPDTMSGVGGAVFSSCTSLTEIVLPSKIKKITSWCFTGCTNLETIVLPTECTEIGYIAFKDCISLTNIIIPNSVTTISNNAFSGVPLIKIYCDNTLINNSNKYGAEAVQTIHDTKEVELIPATCTKSGLKEHYECTVCGRISSDTQGLNEVTLEEITINPTGHSWGAWEYDGEGKKTHTHICINDAEHTETEDCVFNEGVVEGNTKIYTCEICGGTYSETLTLPVEIKGSALVLEGVIQIQFRVIVPEIEEKNVVIKFEGGDALNSYEKTGDARESRYKISETAEGTECYYRIPVYAKQMSDKVTIWFTDKEGNRVSFKTGSGIDVTESGYEYSVEKYISNKWEGSNVKLRGLVRAMKYYGLYAQKYFGYETSIAEEKLNTLEPMEEVSASMLESYVYVKEGEAPEGLKVGSFSLTLEEDIRINYKLSVGEGVEFSDYSIKLDGKNVSPVKGTNGNW